jgi:hypothetical protein
MLDSDLENFLSSWTATSETTLESSMYLDQLKRSVNFRFCLDEVKYFDLSLNEFLSELSHFLAYICRDWAKIQSDLIQAISINTNGGLCINSVHPKHMKWHLLSIEYGLNGPFFTVDLALNGIAGIISRTWTMSSDATPAFEHCGTMLSSFDVSLTSSSDEAITGFKNLY